MRVEELKQSHALTFIKLMATFGETGSEILPEASAWTPFDFKKQVQIKERERLDWRPGQGKISTTYYLLIDPKGAAVALGRMRFPLDEVSEVDGGNLVCEVPPEARGKGLGSVCLSLLLFEAVRAGLRRVLVTCPAEDSAARKVIENNRGTFVDIVASPRAGRAGVKIARYWINFR